MVISETIIYSGHLIVREGGAPVWEVRTRDGKHVSTAPSVRDAQAKVDKIVAGQYMQLQRDLVTIIKDYLAKLERDDFDPRAVGKMKTANAVLKKLQGGM